MKQKRPSPDVQHIVLVKGDGGVGHMQFVTRQHPWKDDPGWTREATDAAIEAEIQRAGCEVTEWHRVGPDAIPSDRSHRDAWVWDGSRIVIDESRIKPRSVAQPQAVQHQPAPADTAPIRAELKEEIASVRKDFSAAVERTFRDLDQRIKERPSTTVDPDTLIRQAESLIAEKVDQAVAEATRRLEERRPQTQLVEVEPGAIDETGPLPHFLDDWKTHGRREEPEPETPEQRRERAIRAIAVAAEERRGQLVSPYPGKRDYYQQKAAIAFKWKMSPNQHYTDMLAREAARKGLSVDQLCSRIIERHYEAERWLQEIHDTEAEGIAAVMRAPEEGVVAAEREAIAKLEAIGGVE